MLRTEDEPDGRIVSVSDIGGPWHHLSGGMKGLGGKRCLERLLRAIGIVERAISTATITRDADRARTGVKGHQPPLAGRYHPVKAGPARRSALSRNSSPHGGWILSAMRESVTLLAQTLPSRTP